MQICEICYKMYMKSRIHFKLYMLNLTCESHNKQKGGNLMFLVIGFCAMFLFYLVAITTLVILTSKQGPQDCIMEDITKLAHK